MTTWLQELSPGDEVVLCWWNGHCGLSESRKRTVVEVERTTPKQVLAGRHRFWKSTGREVGSDRSVSGGYHLEPVNAERARHTEGPWRLDDDGKEWQLRESGGGVIMFLRANGKRLERDEANARLIAAAPAMHEALRVLLDEERRLAPRSWRRAKDALAFVDEGGASCA